MPFEIALMLIIAINTWLVYGTARALGCDKLSAGLAALVACYHPGLKSLQYNIDNIYDVLCFLFFFAGFYYYVRIRQKGRLLNAGQTTIVMVLYLCALNSKEMAVVLPVVLLAYEWLYRPAPKSGGRLWTWLRGPARIAIFQGALNLLYIAGKMFSADALANRPAYSPVLSMQRLIAFQQGSFAELFCWRGLPELAVVFVIWVVLTMLAWRRKSPLLRFCWVCLLITPLPIEFLENRFQACIYIPMAFLAILAAVAMVNAAAAVSAFVNPLQQKVVFASLIGFAVLLWACETYYRNEAFIKPAAAGQGILTHKVIDQLRQLQPRVRPHTQAVFLNDPFVDYDMAFIAQLWFSDRSVVFHLQRKDHSPPEKVAEADHLFDFRDGKLVQLR